VVHPEHRARGQAEQPESRLPDSSVSPASIPAAGKPSAMKGDVPRFVAQDQSAHRADSDIMTVATHQPIVDRTHQFCQEQDRQLEADSEEPPRPAKGGEAPVAVDASASEAGHGLPQQPGVLALFGEPKVNERSNAFAARSKSFGVPGDQRRRASAVAELELLKRSQKRSQNLGGHGARGLPIRFGSVLSVSPKMGEPAVYVHMFPSLLTMPGCVLCIAKYSAVTRKVSKNGLGRQCQPASHRLYGMRAWG
jgi:hypothetical protein